MLATRPVIHPEDLLARFHASYEVDDVTGCWVWLGTRENRRYGQISCDGRLHRAHRLSYEIHHGCFPAYLMVLHRCDNPPCVNPDHLFLGTSHDNTMDAIAKGRHYRKRVAKERGGTCITCVKCGHHRTDDWVQPGGKQKGQGRCRMCQRARDAAKVARDKAVRAVLAKVIP